MFRGSYYRLPPHALQTPMVCGLTLQVLCYLCDRRALAVTAPTYSKFKIVYKTRNTPKPRANPFGIQPAMEMNPPKPATSRAPKSLTSYKHVRSPGSWSFLALHWLEDLPGTTRTAYPRACRARLRSWLQWGVKTRGFGSRRTPEFRHPHFRCLGLRGRGRATQTPNTPQTRSEGSSTHERCAAVKVQAGRLASCLELSST